MSIEPLDIQRVRMEFDAEQLKGIILGENFGSAVYMALIRQNGFIESFPIYEIEKFIEYKLTQIEEELSELEVTGIAQVVETSVNFVTSGRRQALTEKGQQRKERQRTLAALKDLYYSKLNELRNLVQYWTAKQDHARSLQGESLRKFKGTDQLLDDLWVEGKLTLDQRQCISIGDSQELPLPSNWYRASVETIGDGGDVDRRELSDFIDLVIPSIREHTGVRADLSYEMEQINDSLPPKSRIRLLPYNVFERQGKEKPVFPIDRTIRKLEELRNEIIRRKIRAPKGLEAHAILGRENKVLARYGNSLIISVDAFVPAAQNVEFIRKPIVEEKELPVEDEAPTEQGKNDSEYPVQQD